jgi:ribosome-associated protein
VRARNGSRESALIAVEAALEKKALEPVLIDVSAEASYTDFVLIVSARSDRQVQAISDAIIERFASFAVRPIGKEGKGDWVLLDFGSVIVHVFYHPMREFYDLEGLWIESPRVPLEVPAEARYVENMY